MWDDRNKVLHDHKVSETMNGSDHIARACLEELLRGTTGLDDVYHCYFTHSLEEMLQLSPSQQRHWLSLIRRAREAAGHINTDIIASDSALRSRLRLE